MNLTGKNVLVYGYSASGKAATALLLEVGARVWLYDDGEVADSLPDGAERAESFKQAADKADLIVLNPAVPGDKPQIQAAKRAGKRVISEIELASQFCKSQIVAVTGTNGKTTVTLMITEMINNVGRFAHALGNIGVAFSEMAAKLSPTDTAVVEVSSFQLQEIYEFCPDVAVLLNFAPDHLDRHADLAEYAAAKKRIFENQTIGDYAVVNADCPKCLEMASAAKSDIYFFSTQKRVRGAYVEDGSVFFENGKKTYITDSANIGARGKHNLENALAAVCAAMLLGIHPQIIAHTLNIFTPPDYRLQYIGEKRGKKFYNDSKGTNIAATIAAAKSMDAPTALIMGGSGKGEDFTAFFKDIPREICHIFVTGANSADIVQSAVDCGFFNISHRATLKECVLDASLSFAENVLFSPASASFDRYADYRARGEVFNKLFGELQ